MPEVENPRLEKAVVLQTESPFAGWLAVSLTVGSFTACESNRLIDPEVENPRLEKAVVFQTEFRPSDWNTIQYSAHAGSLRPEMGFAIPDMGFNPAC